MTAAKPDAKKEISVLRKIETARAKGKTSREACKEAGITEETYRRLRKQYSHLLASHFPGFDCYAFPGSNAMTTWKAQSPYVFCGYYLQSDNHPDGSWLGTRGTLLGIGWGLAVLYVALPAISPNLSRARGMSDAGQALSQCQADGFPSGTIVFLDVEPVDTLPQPLIDYYKGWIRGILDSKSTGASPFLAPGTYCHSKNANDLLNAAQQEYADAGLPGGAPSFWITKSDLGFDPQTSVPTDSGVSFANLWQGRIDVRGEIWGGVALDIDWDVADSAYPSAPKFMAAIISANKKRRPPVRNKKARRASRKRRPPTKH